MQFSSAILRVLALCSLGVHARLPRQDVVPEGLKTVGIRPLKAGDNLDIRQRIAWNDRTFVETHEVSGTNLVMESEIGGGADGKVYLAKWPKMKTTVVAKSDEAADPSRTVGLLHERQALMHLQEKLPTKKLRHIIHLYYVVYDPLKRPTAQTSHASFLDGHKPSYLVLQYCNRGSLLSFRTTSGVKEATLLKVLAQLLSGIKAMHAVGVEHNDLKVDNVLWSTSSSSSLSKLEATVADFGHASLNNDRFYQKEDLLRFLDICFGLATGLDADHNRYATNVKTSTFETLDKDDLDVGGKRRRKLLSEDFWTFIITNYIDIEQNPDSSITAADLSKQLKKIKTVYSKTLPDTGSSQR